MCVDKGPDTQGAVKLHREKTSIRTPRGIDLNLKKSLTFDKRHDVMRISYSSATYQAREQLTAKPLSIVDFGESGECSRDAKTKPLCESVFLDPPSPP